LEPFSFTFNSQCGCRYLHKHDYAENHKISKPLAASKTKSAGKSEYEQYVCGKEITFLNVL